jgi:hypothetical protein
VHRHGESEMSVKDEVLKGGVVETGLAYATR